VEVVSGEWGLTGCVVYGDGGEGRWPAVVVCAGAVCHVRHCDLRAGGACAVRLCVCLCVCVCWSLSREVKKIFSS